MEKKLKELEDLRNQYSEVLRLSKSLPIKIDKVRHEIDKLNKSHYYVYIVLVDGELRYIGKGSGDRWKHSISGASSVPELNRDHFAGKYIEVRTLGERFTEAMAVEVERDLIYSAVNLCGYSIYNKVKPQVAEELDMDFIRYSYPIKGANNSKCRETRDSNIIKRYGGLGDVTQSSDCVDLLGCFDISSE